MQCITIYMYTLTKEGCPYVLVAIVKDCDIVISKFVFQSRYYVHF